VHTHVILIVVALIGGVGYFVYKNQHKAKTANVTTNTTPVATTPTKTTTPTTQAVDPYASWKTYTSASLKFSFKYPSDWNISERPNNTANTSMTIGVYSPEIAPTDDGEGPALMGPSKGAAMVADVYEDMNFAGLDHYLKAGSISSEAVIENPVKVKVDGNDAAQFDLKSITDTFQTLFHKGDITYGLKYINGTSPDYAKYKSVYTGLVATFKTNN
jgi:hypothetical protein